MSYAEKTSVSVEKSRGEIERTLQRYGAASFVYGWDQNKAMIGFQLQGRSIRMVLTLPLKEDFTQTEKGRDRTEPSAFKAWEQDCRSSWRALLLIIKAKLEGIERKIATFEDEFLAYTVLPNGKTVSEIIQPQIEKALKTGRMPQLLLPGESP